MMTIFLTILITSSLVSTLIILAACVASSRSSGTAYETIARKALVHAPEYSKVNFKGNNEAFAQEMALVTS